MRKAEWPFYDIEFNLKTVKDVVEATCYTYRRNPVFRYKKGKEIHEKDKETFVDDVNRLGSLLHRLYPRGSHIAILGRTSYEWLVSYFAVMNSENIAVPIDKELSVDEIEELLSFSKSICLIYDSCYSEIADKGKDKMNIDGLCMERKAARCLPELLSANADEEVWIGNPKEDDIAEIVFTSGTTGKSKGCMITHGNLAWNAMNGKSFVHMTVNDSVLSILPINHTLEISAGIMTQLCNGVTICINDSIKYMSRNLLLYKPSGMVVVPLIMETMYKNIWKEIRKRGKEKKVLAVMKLVWFLYQCKIDIRRKVFSQILRQLGGNLRILVAGGAYLDPKLIKDFETWGITVVQGYGVTECAPVIACNTDRYKKYDSVGKVSTGCEVKIVDHEIWVKGSVVMKGYFNDQKATEEVFEGEWLKTGDLGYLDKENFLYLTGRKKNLIILSNGENVSPEELEQKIQRIPYIKEVVVSEKDGKIQAEVYLDKKEEPLAEDKISKDLDALNRTLPSYKKISKTVIRETEFEKTTTGKIKR